MAHTEHISKCENTDLVEDCSGHRKATFNLNYSVLQKGLDKQNPVAKKSFTDPLYGKMVSERLKASQPFK